MKPFFSTAQRHNNRANSAQGAGAQVKEKGREGRTGPSGAAAFESAQVNCEELDSLGPQEKAEAERLLKLWRIGPHVSFYTHHAKRMEQKTVFRRILYIHPART